MNKNFFYISKPRCASTHLFEGLTGWNDSVHGNKPYYHLPAYQMKKIFGDRFTNSFSFSVIRNPYDLVLSWYNEHRKERYEKHIREFYNIPFEQWVDSGCPTHWNHFSFNPLQQYKWIYDDNGDNIVTYLIRIEDYKNGLKQVFENTKQFLHSSVTLDTITNTRKNESVNVIKLDEEVKTKIYKLFHKDFELFNYDK